MRDSYHQAPGRLRLRLSISLTSADLAQHVRSFLWNSGPISKRGVAVGRLSYHQCYEWWDHVKNKHRILYGSHFFWCLSKAPTQDPCPFHKGPKYPNNECAGFLCQKIYLVLCRYLPFLWVWDLPEVLTAAHVFLRLKTPHTHRDPTNHGFWYSPLYWALEPECDLDVYVVVGRPD